jgi:hypothetical protein
MVEQLVGPESWKSICSMLSIPLANTSPTPFLLKSLPAIVPSAWASACPMPAATT